MQTLTLGRLKVRIARTPSNETIEPPLVVVLLHGFGAPGDDLAGLAGAFDVPPGTWLVFPEALHSLREFVGPLSGDARAWWMIDIPALERAIARKEPRILMDEVPEGLAEARASVSEMLDALGEMVSLDRLVLGGFSQGAMLSLDVALRDPRRKLAGLVLLSGTFLAEREWTPLLEGRSRLPVFQSHGESDPILPYGIAERLRGALVDAKLDVTFDRFAAGHTIPPRTLAALAAWIRALP